MVAIAKIEDVCTEARFITQSLILNKYSKVWSIKKSKSTQIGKKEELI